MGKESCSSSASPQTPGREPGAVIESFVSHSPGVFSGTFSGTLPPVSQSGVSHPRRGIATILQILNDLLSATRHHKGAPASLCQLRGPGPASSSCPLTSDPPAAATTSSRATSEPSTTSSLRPAPQQTSPPAKHTDEGSCPQTPSSSEENRALRCKLESLQLLMYQQRLRRRARRGAHPSHASAHPYSQRLRHPWSPGQRKAARRHSNGSLSGSEGTSQDDTEADEVMEGSPWKPELTSDLVVA
ncbi:midnolin-B-like [Osmerus eperlanus]|uniref:midnolin-B-like n=1 Tax=Osmerus eperlanus TaxID=29151 RepID=UPI002E0E35F2